MKKLLFLLLITAVSYGQTYQNPTFGTVTTKTSPTVTNDPYVTTTGTTGIQGKIAPVNLIIPHTPVNYTVPNLTIGAHLAGIDTRLGQISSTTAGLTQRIYFTADDTTVNSVVYFASNSTGKGATAAGSPPALVLADNTKGYFTKDLISIPQPAATIGYAGSYSGNLTVSATPTPVATQQRFTVEVYRTNNLGTPIASGVSGAPVGDLGVTVVAILDSGIINLTAGSITNVSVTGILTQNITINTGERLRYHVSAAKIGAGGGNVTFGVYYGSSYNSYYDVPVAITTDAVVNKSTVVGVTDTDALNTLNAKIPANYSKVVYVNNANPNAATIFDLSNPPTVNNNALKSDVNNLYVGNDSSGWVYNSTSLTYVTNTITSTLSNFYISGTTTDAGGNKTGHIYRTGRTNFEGNIAIGSNTLPSASQNVTVGGMITGNTTAISVMSQGVVQSDVIGAAYGFRSNLATQTASFTLPSLGHYNATQGIFGAGSIVTNQIGYYATASLSGATNNYGFRGDIVSGTNNWNCYMSGTAKNYFAGNVLINDLTDNGVDKLQVGGTIEASAATTANQVIIKSQLDAAVPYKKYVALISQSGTSAPTATVLENTLGGTVVWTRTTSGQFTGTLSGAFTANKTIGFFQYTSFTSPSNTYTSAFDDTTTNTVDLRTSINGTLSDNFAGQIEIRVYN